MYNELCSRASTAIGKLLRDRSMLAPTSDHQTAQRNGSIASNMYTLRWQTVVSPPGYSVKTIIDPTTCVGMHNHYCWGFVDGIKKHHHDVDPDVGMLQHYKRCHFSTDECRQMMKDIRSDNTMLKYRQKLSRVVSQKLTSFYRWSSQRWMTTDLHKYRSVRMTPVVTTPSELVSKQVRHKFM